MICPKCNSNNLTCIDSRPSENVTRRRRVCCECKHRFSTIEINISEYNELKDNQMLLTNMRSISQEVIEALKSFRGNIK